jgi:glutathione S-transferase
VNDIQLIGADYSVYFRIVRMTMLEKQIDHEIIPFDVFSVSSKSKDSLQRQPFGKIPVLVVPDLELYETGAISRYLDEAYAGQKLQPTDAAGRARMNQIISIADNYLYPHLVWGLYVELVSKRNEGEKPSWRKVAAARKLAPTCLGVLNQFLVGNDWFAGSEISLADIYIAPMLDCFMLVPGAKEMLSSNLELERWWRSISERESFSGTSPV